MTRAIAIGLVAIWAAGCGEGALSEAADDEGAAKRDAGSAQPRPGAASGPTPSPGAPGASGTATAPPPPPPPPEMEERRAFEVPHAGARFVYVANPRRDTVAVIDSATLAIRPVEVGDTPTLVRTVPGKDLALVINAGSNELSVLRTDGAGATRVTSAPIVPGANAVAIAPDGAHAIVWYDTSGRGGTRPTSAAGSFQEVSVVRLGAMDTALRLAVGFRPLEVEFAADGSAAFVITEDGVSVVRFADLRGPGVAPFVPLDPAAGTATRDVAVTPDGRFALARREGSSELQLVDLAARTTRAVDLGGVVTDLDLAPGGEFALAVLRQQNAVVRVALPGGFSDPAQRQRLDVTGETIGSATLTPDGKTAVLYTTVGNVERLAILPLDGGRAIPVRLRKAVRAVAIAPDGRTALVVHTKVAGDPLDPRVDIEVAIDRAHGYSAVDLRTGFAKLQLTDAPVGELAITPDASRAFVLLRDDARSIRVAQRLHLESLLVDDFPLGSPPLAVAALAESKRMFVSQLHPEGRISFIQWETGAVESVTGFELNGRIVQ